MKTKATEGQTWTFNTIGAGVIMGSPQWREVQIPSGCGFNPSSVLESHQTCESHSVGNLPYRETLEKLAPPPHRRRIGGAELPPAPPETGGAVWKVLKWPLRLDAFFPAAFCSSALTQTWQPPSPRSFPLPSCTWLTSTQALAQFCLLHEGA